ncbi:TPA: hypothetical protein ACH3X2_011070 [Trebouxia sp. C0005]
MLSGDESEESPASGATPAAPSRASRQAHLAANELETAADDFPMQSPYEQLNATQDSIGLEHELLMQRQRQRTVDASSGSDFQGIDDLNISASLLLPDFDTENAACGSTHQPDVSIADIEDVTQDEDATDVLSHMTMVLRDMPADEIGTCAQRPRLATLSAMSKSPGQALEAFHNFRKECGSNPIAPYLLKHRASCVVDPRHCTTSLLDGMEGLERHELWYVRFSSSQESDSVGTGVRNTILDRFWRQIATAPTS